MCKVLQFVCKSERKSKIISGYALYFGLHIRLFHDFQGDLSPIPNDQSGRYETGTSRDPRGKHFWVSGTVEENPSNDDLKSP